MQSFVIILCPAKTAIKLLVYLYLIDDDALCTFLRNNQIPQFFNVIILFSTRGTHLTLSIHFLYRIHLPTPSFDSVIPSTQLAPCLPNPLPFVVHRSKLIFKQNADQACQWAKVMQIQLLQLMNYQLLLWIVYLLYISQWRE